MQQIEIFGGKFDEVKKKVNAFLKKGGTERISISLTTSATTDGYGRDYLYVCVLYENKEE